MDLINTAAAAWEVVKESRPTASLSGSFANGIPEGANWQDLSKPVGTATFRWTFENGWLLPDFSFDLSLHWNYGARWRNGGAFITNCWMEVHDVTISMGGINVDISCSVGNPENGARRTHRSRSFQSSCRWATPPGYGVVPAQVWGNGLGTFSNSFEDETAFRLPDTGTSTLEPAPK